ncbi:MAG: hypothetical protein ACOCQR_01315 [bacterium]
MKKNKLIIAFFCLFLFLIFNTTIFAISGVIIDQETQKPIQNTLIHVERFYLETNPQDHFQINNDSEINIQVYMANELHYAITDENGKFSIEVPNEIDEYKITIANPLYKTIIIPSKYNVFNLEQQNLKTEFALEPLTKSTVEENFYKVIQNLSYHGDLTPEILKTYNKIDDYILFILETLANEYPKQRITLNPYMNSFIYLPITSFKDMYSFLWKYNHNAIENPQIKLQEYNEKNLTTFFRRNINILNDFFWAEEEKEKMYKEIIKKQEDYLRKNPNDLDCLLDITFGLNHFLINSLNKEEQLALYKEIISLEDKIKEQLSTDNFIIFQQHLKAKWDNDKFSNEIKQNGRKAFSNNY